MSFSPRRQAVPQELLQGAPEWGRTVADVLNRNSEELARGVEVAQSSAARTLEVTVTLPLAQPLTLASAAGAKALWVGRAQTQAGEAVLAPAIAWHPSRAGAVLREVEADAGTYRLTLTWVTT